jgi:hypothetical protein
MSQVIGQSPLVDLRGFNYALEPLHQKQKWHMDRLQCELVQAQAVWLVAKNDLVNLQRTFHDQSELAREALLKRFDPQTHRQTLTYLAQLGQKVQESVQTELKMREAKEAIFADVIEQQKKLDVLVEHKNAELADYVRESSRLDQMQMDRDWIARTNFTEKNATAVEIEAQEGGHA